MRKHHWPDVTELDGFLFLEPQQSFFHLLQLLFKDSIIRVWRIWHGLGGEIPLDVGGNAEQGMDVDEDVLQRHWLLGPVADGAVLT